MEYSERSHAGANNTGPVDRGFEEVLPQMFQVAEQPHIYHYSRGKV